MKNYKIFIALFAFSIIGMNTQGQFLQEWVKTYTGSDSSSNVSTAIGPHGNIYVTRKGENSGTQGIITLKYAPSGELLWSAFSVGQYSVGIKVDSASNAYVAGLSSNNNFLTIKYDSAGFQQWSNIASGTGIPLDIALDNSNNVIVTGSSIGLANSHRITTVKYQSNGNQVWLVNFQNNLNTTAPATGRDLTTDPAGNIYIAGESGNDFTTLKYSATGILQWSVYYNGIINGQDYANSIVLDATNNIYVVGSTTSLTGLDFITIKYNSSGITQWRSQYNGIGNGNDVAKSIAIDGNGNVDVIGSTTSLLTGKDYATIQYNNYGNLNWVQTYNGSGNGLDEATALALNNNGEIYITGISEGNGTGADYATIKYAQNGNLEWVQRFDGTANSLDKATSLGVDLEGNLYVAGQSKKIGLNYEIVTIKYNTEEADVPSVEEALFDNQLKVLSKGLLNIIKDTTFRRILYSEAAKDTPWFEVPLSKLIIESAKAGINLVQIMNETIKQFNGDLILSDYVNLSMDKLVYKGIKYNPVIYLPNFDSLNLSNSPIVAPGVEDINDNVSGWVITDGKLSTTPIDENYAKRTQIPIIIVTSGTTEPPQSPVAVCGDGNCESSKGEDYFTCPADCYFCGDQKCEGNKGENYTNCPIDCPPPPPCPNSSGHPYISDFQINYRYDTSRNSEYSYCWDYLYKDGSMRDGGTRYEIKEVPKNKIGQPYSGQNGYMQESDDYNYNIAGLWVVTFEYDWYAGKKPVGVKDGPQERVVDCKMHFSDEYYQVFFINYADGYRCNKDVFSKGFIKIPFY